MPICKYFMAIEEIIIIISFRWQVEIQKIHLSWVKHDDTIEQSSITFFGLHEADPMAEWGKGKEMFVPLSFSSSNHFKKKIGMLLYFSEPYKIWYLKFRSVCLYLVVGLGGPF